MASTEQIFILRRWRTTDSESWKYSLKDSETKKITYYESVEKLLDILSDSNINSWAEYKSIENKQENE